MKSDRHVKIFDTTLRDGQQCPGAGMGFKENLEYAELATQLRVDVLEAGFPAASAMDFEIVRVIATEIASRSESPEIAALCQLRDEQIDRTIEALEPAIKFKKAKMHTYLPVDPQLMEVSLGARASDKAGFVRDVGAFVKRAIDAGLSVEFSPEGYSRMGENFDFVTDLFRAAVEAGASVINCPDTIGGACQYQGPEYYVEKLKRHAAIISEEYPTKQITWSAHCHNDFGLAVENSINAVFRGPCRQIEGCINGVGERAGNAALEQCIMVIKHFGEQVDPENPFYTQINTGKIQQICDFVGKNMLPRQPHWPITGKNAAKHSAGGHTNAVLKDPLVYQPFDPREVGKSVSIVFGPLSGGNHAKSIVEDAGYDCSDEEKAELAQFIKSIYEDRRKGITDEELIEGYFRYRRPIDVVQFDYSRSATRSEIFLKGKFFELNGEIRRSHEGRDSALAALKEAIDDEFAGFRIQSHKSRSRGEGISATSFSTIVIVDDDGSAFKGQGEDQDIEISAMKALIDAYNRAYVNKHFKLSKQERAA